MAATALTDLFEGSMSSDTEPDARLLTALSRNTSANDLSRLSGPLKRVGSLESMHETLASDGRPELIRRLSSAGIERLPDRQMIANAVSKFARQQPPPTVYPGDEQGHFFTTPWNWALEDGVAVTATPGAYAKVAWRGGAPDGVVEIGIDNSESPEAAFMTVRFTLDGMGEAFSVGVPPRDHEPRIRVSVDSLLGVERSPLTERRTLTIGVQNSRQSIDRWGDESEGRLPTGSLRIKWIRLPAGSIPSRPILQPRRLLVYGDSIVEGVGADYRKGSSGDLQANVGLSTWASYLATNLKCELSSVGYGRLGWSIQGNGNVPPFPSSWDKVFAGVPRSFGSDGSSKPPDIIMINLGTNDGLITGAASCEALTSHVQEWLTKQRAAVGPTTHIIVCVPFGGFGANRPPVNMISQAFDEYQETSGGDKNCHLIDLGEDAALHLTGFRFKEGTGELDSTPESADGLHPTRARHAQLAQMLRKRIERVLDESRVLAGDGELAGEALLLRAPSVDCMIAMGDALNLS